MINCFTIYNLLHRLLVSWTQGMWAAQSKQKVLRCENNSSLLYKPSCFLPICLMYYYSLQIKNGIQNHKNFFISEGCDWPRIPSRGSVLPVTALPPLLPSQHRSTRTGSWRCSKFPFVSLFWFVGLHLWVAGAPTFPTLKRLLQQISFRRGPTRPQHSGTLSPHSNGGSVISSWGCLTASWNVYLLLRLNGSIRPPTLWHCYTPGVCALSPSGFPNSVAQ
jgi:hypothetical protein